MLVGGEAEPGDGGERVDDEEEYEKDYAEDVVDEDIKDDARGTIDDPIDPSISFLIDKPIVRQNTRGDEQGAHEFNDEVLLQGVVIDDESSKEIV